MTAPTLRTRLVSTLGLAFLAFGCRDPQLVACGKFGRELQEGELGLKRALLAASSASKDAQRETLRRELGRLGQKLEQPSPVPEIASARQAYARAISSAAARLAAPAPSADPRLVLHDLTTNEAMAFRKTMDTCSGAR